MQQDVLLGLRKYLAYTGLHQRILEHLRQKLRILAHRYASIYWANTD